MNTGNNDITVCYYIVGFFDLLGQQDLLRAIQSFPNEENLEEVETFKETILKTYRSVKSLRQSLSNAFGSFSTSGVDEKDLNTEQKTFIEQFRKHDLKFQHFSDTVIMYCPMRADINRVPHRTIFGVLSAAALTFISCLAEGHPIRGGIDIGMGLEIDDNEIYGPVLSRAYTLESKCAHYPRIVVGSELTNFLRQSTTVAGVDLESVATRSVAQRCLDLLAADDDGFLFIDYLGEHLQTILNGPLNDEIIKNGYSFIIKESSKHQADNNSKLAFRYTLLRNYFENRIPSLMNG
jgi:hypothetical protein